MSRQDERHRAADISDVQPRDLEPQRKDKGYPDLFRTGESAMIDQGIDPDAFPEQNLPTKQVMTPSGMKTAICFMDATSMKHRPSDSDLHFQPGYPLPEIGHVWSDRKATLNGQGNFIPEFSARTTEQMKFCEYFSSGLLVRLVCVPPLQTSQLFWIHRTNRSDSSNTFRSEMGFSWKPSAQNEVFLLFPWLSENATLQYNAPLNLAFLRLGITPLSDLIREEGTATDLDVNVYFCPYDMRLGVPRPVERTTSANFVTEELLALPGGLTLGAGTFPVGTVTVDSTCKIGVLDMRTASTVNDSYRITLNIDGGLNLAIYDLEDLLGSNAGFYDSAVIELAPGTYTINAVVTGDAASGTSFTANGILFRFDSLSGANPVFNPATLKITEGPTQYDPPWAVKDGWNQHIILDPTMTNPISLLANGLHLSGQRSRAQTKVISQNPNVVRTDYYINDQLAATAFANDGKTAKYKCCIALLKLIVEPERSGVIDGERQIYEYSYDVRSTAADRYFGHMGDHSVREDTHWQQFDTQNLTEATKDDIYNITFDLSNIPSGFPPVATREYSRHLLKYRIPNVKLQVLKTPLSNLLLRVTNGTQTSVEQAMQLPGKEWNPSKDLMIEPYWFYQNPAQSSVSLNLTVVVLSGSISDAGAQLVSLFNTGNLEYYHMRDYDFPQFSAAKSEELEEYVPRKWKIPKVVVGTRQIGQTVETSLAASECKETPSENTQRPESTSLLTAMSVKEHDAAETKLGGIKTVVGAIEVNLATTKLVAIPISHINFPKMIVNTAKKYYRWRGRPKYNITLTSNVTLASVAYVSQVDSDFDFSSSTALDAILMQPNARELVRGNATEIEVAWRVPSGAPWQRVDYAGVPQLGFLAIVLPFQSSTLGTLDTNVKIMIECNTSNIEYSGAAYPFDNFDFPGLSFTTYSV